MTGLEAILCWVIGGLVAGVIVGKVLERMDEMSSDGTTEPEPEPFISEEDKRAEAWSDEERMP